MMSQQAPGQILQQDFAPVFYKTDVLFNCHSLFPAGCAFCPLYQTAFNIHAGLKPCRIENHQIEGVYLSSVSPGESMIPKHNRKGAASIYCLHLTDDLIQRYLVSIISVQGMQARWAT